MPTILSILKQFHSKETAQAIADSAASDPARLAELMDCFFHEEMRICQRAAWPVGILGKSHTELLYPYLEAMLTNLNTPHHDAVVRNTMRTFQFMTFPEDMEGQVFDVSLSLLMDMGNATGIRVFAMTVCANICMKYPALASELIPVIEEQLPHGSVGFKSRGGKLLSKLRSLA